MCVQHNRFLNNALSYAKQSMKVDKISQFVQIQSKPLNESYTKRTKSKQSYNVVVTQEHLFPLHVLKRMTGSWELIGWWYGYMSRWW